MCPLIPRNHEVGQGVGAFVTGDLTYDPRSGGGNTNLVFDPDAGQWLGATPSLAGTVRNCAGGATPWNTWLSCEETFLVDQERHGYTFEVPADGVSDAVPLIGLGRFSHEANAVDPTTGYVYETEDRGDSCLYRFVPATYGDLAGGGTLQAMVLAGDGAGPNGVVNTGPFASGLWTVSWVDLDDPDPDVERAPTPPLDPGVGLRYEAQSKGAAIIRRGEGTWWGNGLLYVVSTNGGPVSEGQVFALDPVAGKFEIVFASSDESVLDNPDNIAVSPRGGLVLCEDGDRDFQKLRGLTTDGTIFTFAENRVVLNGERNGITGNFVGSEWAGATFEPKNGNWLFVNIQTPGITFAITGPWKKGAL